ncbi:MAG TPA: hypothetical protein VII92_19110 [Anaerolineae bacterium]
MDDVIPEVKRAVIEQESAMWRNTRYQLQLRHRVNKALGAADVLVQIEKELEKCEKALDVLDVVLSELRNGEVTP